MFASAWLLLAPPVAPAGLAVTRICLFGSIVTLTVHLRGVALAGHAGLRGLRAMIDGSSPEPDTGAALFAAALRDTLDRGVADPARTQDAALAAVSDEGAAAS